MRVVFLVSHLWNGGAERTVAYLSDYFSSVGCEVIILSMSNAVYFSVNQSVKLEVLNVSEYSKDNDTIIAKIKRYLTINKKIAEICPDVVFCMIYENAKYFLMLPQKRKFKLITSVRNNPMLLKDKKAIKLREKILMKSDGVIFQTQRAQDFFNSKIRNHSVVIQNAVGNNDVYCFKHNHSHGNYGCWISAVGRLIPEKDYSTLINAFQIVNKKHNEYSLHIFGEGSEYSYLVDLVEKKGITDKVVFEGIQDSFIEKIVSSACYVLSSVSEGMPNSLMEAMAIGLPCVATDCPNGPAELIRNRENGLIVSVRDEVGLADAICEFIENPKFASECGFNAQRILKTNNINVIAARYLDYINEVVNKDRMSK